MKIWLKASALFCLSFVAPALPLQAVTVEQIVSREDPKFDCAKARMTVGRDGNVYLNYSPHDAAYILRVSRDGIERRGGNAVYAMGNATANAQGIIASANSHFNHSVNFYDRNFNRVTACSEFLVNDQVGWNAPARVEAGASGDFYGIDQHRLRILRITPAGKIVQVFAIPKDAKASDFRVCEATQALLLRSGDKLWCLGFDGAVRWTQAFPGGAWTVDDAGLVYLQTGGANVVKRWSAAGEMLPDLLLTGGAQGRGATDLGVFGGDLLIKRADPTELFQVFSLPDGTFRHAVQTEHERLAVEVPGLTWTAGETLPLAITFTGPGAPQWRVWLTPLGDTAWRELTVTNGQVSVPGDLAGLYQFRLAPTLNPQAESEYTVRAVVEVRVPGSRGTVSVWTPLNRVWWGRGEDLPVEVILRTGEMNAAKAVTLNLKSQISNLNSPPAVLWSTNLTLTANTSATIRVPAALTAQLAPGRYELRADAPGFTCVTQLIRIGPGMESASPFRVTQHGDYGNFNSKANAWEFADTAEDMLTRARTLGVNQYVNRIHAGGYPLSFPGDDLAMLRELEKRLAADPAGVAPQKVEFGFPQAHALGAYGANGLREWLLLLSMDAMLPMGTSAYYGGLITPESTGKEIAKYTPALRQFPAFQGWDWVANWWADRSKGFATPEEKTSYDAALKKANETGEWDPVLDTAGDRAVNWQVDAQRCFKDSLDKVDAKLRTSSAGPYRRPEVYPPVSFANVDEVDLHFQAEQIATPNWTVLAPDFYKRPNKPAWMHPELWNDSGTGEQILPLTWLAVMRGVDGIGVSGSIGGGSATEPRSGSPGTPSVFRALHTFVRQYGPWLMTLENNDAIAIPVSYRQIKLDAWGGIGGQYFTRLWEAYMTCLYARRPATFVFAEDKPNLSRFKALLLVGQRYEPEPALSALLAQARQSGIPLFFDGTCRVSLATNATPVGATFDRIEKLHGFNNDAAYWEFADALRAQAANVAQTLGAVAPPVGECDQPEILLSERRSGEARFVWAVNNTFTPLDPGKLWRVQPAVATHTPVVAQVKLPVKKGEVVYDVFAGEEVRSRESEVSMEADLRYSAARLYAILPRAITKVKVDVPRKLNPGQTFTWTAAVPGVKALLPMHIESRDATGALIEERFTTTGTGTFTVPINAALPVTLSATELISGKTAPIGPLSSLFGPRLRDLAVSTDGSTALLNAFDWGQNVYTLDLTNGKVRWSGNVGDYFAYTPVAMPNGFAVQGYDLNSGEGYHLYQLSRDGVARRRFALPGLPARLTSWAFAGSMADRPGTFIVAPDGTWVAGAGNLALAVWSLDGNLLWSQDWSATNRATPRLLGAGNATLLVARGMTLTAYDARTGAEQWTVTPDPAGEIQGLSVSADGRTVAARASTRSGRVYVLRDGKLSGTLPTGADETVVSPDGAWLAITTGRNLKCYAADGGLRWTFQADDTLRFPRLAPDGKRLAVGSDLGTLYVVDMVGTDRRAVRSVPDDGAPGGHALPGMWQRDLGALLVTAWLPNGALVAATWMGTVARFDGAMEEKWRVKVGDKTPISNFRSQILDHTPPTSRLTSWSNAESTPLPLTPNLIGPKAVIVRALLGDGEVALQNSAVALFDGQTNAPVNPWIKWADLVMIDSGWKGSFTLEIDTFRTQLRVTAITFVEDAAHPESWLRDARLEYWDPAGAKWVFAQYLTADATVHTHKLVKPVEASRFRLARPGGTGWPASNLRLAEIVFHGETLGGSHPDAIQNRPVAVLFDEDKAALQCLVSGFNPQFEFRSGQGASGATFMALKAEGAAGAGWQPPFGHAVANWNFEIVEKPEKPGQYRWLQFACKALAPETRGLSLRLGHEWPGGALVVDVGEPIKLKEGVWTRRLMADKPAAEWTVVRLDVWQTLQDQRKGWNGSMSIRCINVFAVGGGAAFDQILLGRTEDDLKAVPPVKP
ncbi:MAG: PQQ-binding-like beta-propeller repeat protein [Planctomycetota bacterium]|nr:PQQ-binding-like beta-propeller repeat protein [Planctomycetota bacterium]